ncbi:RIO1 family-domain-containing protein [Gloeopeniophorella convolvens]|nr:RIO1 family-domain-containing protein [Gloeopeniophorella convolvens]
MSATEPIIEDGQFDDATNDGSENPRQGHNYIDDPLPELSEDSSEEDDDLELEELDELARAEDEDWEVAERDFTKQYNRLRQHLAVNAGNAQGVASSIKQSASVASLPAVNRPKLPSTPKTPAPDQLLALAKYSSRLAKVDVPYMMGVGVNRKGPSSYANMKDKSDRATNEQVLDPRTRIILFKMIGRGLIHEVNGCVSTGKEANVYHALTPQSTHLALKIYKTSILIFKDRDRYVTGEHRFRRGYSRRNPRKMVRLWAEKELRNLRRLRAAGIPCPEPLEVRENVLVMGFLGDKEGWRRRDRRQIELHISYSELVLNVRKLFHQCKLVHADLSEYNILYHEGHPYIIDVSQSVEHDHPSAFDFLRSDIKNIEGFFSKMGVQCLGMRRCFEFIVRETLDIAGGPTDEDILEEWLNITVSDVHSGEVTPQNASGQAVHEDLVFQKSYIPRTLGELYDPERDIAALSLGDGPKPIYANTIELVQTTTVVPDAQPEDPEDLQAPLPEEGPQDSDSSVDCQDGDQGRPFEDRLPRGHRHEDRELKKERKKVVKAEQRERRKTKMPKAEKKKHMKASR